MNVEQIKASQAKIKTMLDVLDKLLTVGTITNEEDAILTNYLREH